MVRPGDGRFLAICAKAQAMKNMKSITAKRLAVMLLVTGMGVSAGRAATFTPVAELPFSARGAVYDPGRARLYLSQSESNRVWI